MSAAGEEQRRLFEQVMMPVRTVVELFGTAEDAVLRQLPAAVVHDLVAQVVVGHLVGAGVVAAPLPEWSVGSGDWRGSVPVGLQPSVGRVFEGYRRLLAELRDGPHHHGT